MKLTFLVIFIAICVGCSKPTVTFGESISANELESFFRAHKVENNYVVAIKKRSVADAYLATIHGYPNNLSVCEDLIAPYNKNQSLSVIPGEYYCEVLR